MDAPHEQTPAPRLYWSHDGLIGSTDRRSGGRYLITRWDNQWLIRYVPAPGYPGVAQQMERVPWIGDRRTLRAAQQSCVAHAHRSVEKDLKLEEHRAREFGDRGF